MYIYNLYNYLCQIILERGLITFGYENVHTQIEIEICLWYMIICISLKLKKLNK